MDPFQNKVNIWGLIRHIDHMEVHFSNSGLDRIEKSHFFGRPARRAFLRGRPPQLDLPLRCPAFRVA
eukprot:SAG31_NODE_40878_length_278_cov_1.446927_1_plen_66_part_10